MQCGIILNKKKIFFTQYTTQKIAKIQKYISEVKEKFKTNLGHIGKNKIHQFVVTGTNLFIEMWPFWAFLCLFAEPWRRANRSTWCVWTMSWWNIWRIMLHYQLQCEGGCLVMEWSVGHMALTEIVLQSTGQFWLLLELGLALTAVSGGGECPLGMPTAYEWKFGRSKNVYVGILLVPSCIPLSKTFSSKVEELLKH